MSVGGRELHRYLAAWPVLGVFLAVFASYQLYPGIIHDAVGELRRLGLGLTTSFLLLGSAIYLSHRSADYSRGAFLLWWFAAMALTPLVRSGVRGLVCRQPWWGVPLAVFYTGDSSLDMIREMQSHPEAGWKPVVVLANSLAVRSRLDLPVVGLGFAAAVRRCGVTRAAVAMPATGSGDSLLDLADYANLFPRLMIVHSAPALYSLTLDACPIAGSHGVEVRRDLLLPFPRLVKRTMDLVISCLGLPVVGLTLCLLGFLVWLESPGPVFFGHRRIGRANVTFLAWKLRTMHVNAEQLLHEALSRDGALREEWRCHRKLRRDPRITRFGRFLRKTSLDELPQLWNVLRGEMSLVGPRPIVEEEVDDYGPEFSLYCRVTPGITGLWQVSGRNMVTTRDRVRLDSYYVRNWSPWLDLHILARTAVVVLTGYGAY
jgi:Undecaprenyl-phosphate galactose phosphotransferase WbaP